jgi:hypothetical protein
MSRSNLRLVSPLLLQLALCYTETKAIADLLIERKDMMSDVSTPIEVFCVYTHEDRPFRLTLEKHLRWLKYEGLVST